MRNLAVCNRGGDGEHKIVHDLFHCKGAKVISLFLDLCTAPLLELHLRSCHNGLKFQVVPDVSTSDGQATESTGLSCFMFHLNFSKERAKPSYSFFHQTIQLNIYL